MSVFPTSEIFKFIQDFSLRKPNGLTNFEASIDFHLHDGKKTLETEVQIITSDHLEVIYLTGTEVSDTNLPDMFKQGDMEFKYIPHKCLEIVHPKANPELIVIFPKIQEG